MRRLTLFTALILALAARAQASPITYTGTSGTRAAAVTFDTSGSNLIVTLTNTSLFDALVPTDLLTGVFFDYLDGPLTLNRVSAVLNAGSSVLYDSAPGGVVGGEWAYADGIGDDAPNGGSSYGISSSGLGLFGPGDNFPGANLDGPVSVNGMGYGLTSAGDITATGNSAVTGGFPLIKNSVVFTLSGFSSGYDVSRITNVTFQYGTSLSEPHVSVPEPGSLLLLVVSAAFVARRRGAVRSRKEL